MRKKKSYMNVSNIINEGILNKIIDFIEKRRIKKLEKAFKSRPEIQSKIKKFNKDARDFEKFLKSQGIDQEIYKIK